jgi:hypothetical protein
LKRILVILTLALAVLYLCDYLSVRYRVPNRDPFGSVTIEHYYAVHEKSGKTEFIFQNPETQKCVRSLFPHLGLLPCWYGNWKREKRVDI